MTGYHTRWVRPEELADDPERFRRLLTEQVRVGDLLAAA